MRVSRALARRWRAALSSGVGSNEPDRAIVRIGHARLDEADGIAAVHVSAWRSAYAGLLPDHTLTGMSEARHAVHYAHMIRREDGVLVARTPTVPHVVGFATASPRGDGAPAAGEVHTLYVLDDWRERGIGRSLLQAAARHLAGLGCRSLFLWVLADNPSRWFYERLGGRATMRSATPTGGRMLPTVAMTWDRIETLSGSPPSPG